MEKINCEQNRWKRVDELGSTYIHARSDHQSGHNVFFDSWMLLAFSFAAFSCHFARRHHNVFHCTHTFVLFLANGIFEDRIHQKHELCGTRLSASCSHSITLRTSEMSTTTMSTKRKHSASISYLLWRCDDVIRAKVKMAKIISFLCLSVCCLVISVIVQLCVPKIRQPISIWNDFEFRHRKRFFAFKETIFSTYWRSQRSSNVTLFVSALMNVFVLVSSIATHFRRLSTDHRRQTTTAKGARRKTTILPQWRTIRRNCEQNKSPLNTS